MFRRIVESTGQATSVAACPDWLFIATTAGQLVVCENRPAFGYPMHRVYPFGNRVIDVMRVSGESLKVHLAGDPSDLFRVFRIKEPIRIDPVINSSIDYVVSGVGTKVVSIVINTFSITLTNAILKSRIMACAVALVDHAALAIAYCESCELLVWRLEDRAYLVKTVGGLPRLTGQVQLVVSVFGGDVVAVLLGGGNGGVFYEVKVVSEWVKWTAMVPRVKSIGAKSEVYVERENEFDLNLAANW
jgi:hypothetical protein